jgi:serine/threonine-protein kinase
MIGRTLSHYSIVEKIGAGGMGEVYKAHDERLDRDVAIKVLPSGTLGDETARKRFRKEALALSKLNHPNIATVFDFDTQEGVDFIVMELVEGASLYEKVKTGPLPEKEISEIGAQVAGNIAVTPKGRVKVLDFGLAKLIRPVSDEATTAAMTEELAVVGTLPYMSPEELRGERADHRSDLYSLGVALYEMATGRRPFEEKLPTALTMAIVQKLPEPPRKHNRKVSPGLESIILKALDKDPNHRYQSAREMWLWAAVCVFAVIAAAILLNVGGLRDALVGESGPRIDSIAVLPLENLSGDPEQEYFADGMTDALIADLAKIGALRVISRQSVMQFKGSAAPLSEIASRLDVDAVVEGSVLHSGNRVRITTQLVQVSPERHLWADSYEKDLRDILTLQSEVARQITREIEATVTPEEGQRLASTRPVDPEAHEAYLRGKYSFDRGPVDGWHRAIGYYEQAIEKDPQYAPPYASLAHTLALLSFWAGATSDEIYPRAKDAAQRAIELDDTLAEAHRALGRIALFYDWDWAAAEREYQRAIELEPGSADAHLSYGHYLVWMGRSEDGIAEGRYAVELDPLTLMTNTLIGTNLYLARRYDEAIEQSEKVLDMDPNFGDAYHWLFNSYAKKEQYEDAFAACQKMNELTGPTVASLWCYPYVYALWGKREEAMRALSAPGWKEVPAPEWLRATVYGALGENDEAFRLLDQAYEERSPYMAVAKVDPRLDPLRDDPRFQDFLRRMNFPE